MRNNIGTWISGFMQKIGYCSSSTEAELIAIKTGLQLCKAQGFKKVLLYTYSLQAFQFLTRGHNIEHPLANVIEEIKSTISIGWDVQIRQTNREIIKCADFLARNAHNVNSQLAVLLDPPADCLPQMLADLG